MSGYTMTQPEVYYSFSGASTNLATFTTEDNLLKTYPPCEVPATFWKTLGSRSSTMKIRAYGQLGTTSAPTFTFSLRLLTSTTWSAGGILLGSSNAITAATTVTLAGWQLDADVTLRSIAAAGSATSSLATHGTLSGTGFPTTGMIPANNVSPVVSTLDVSGTSQYWLFLSCACGTSNALNLINTQTFKMYLEN